MTNMINRTRVTLLLATTLLPTSALIGQTTPNNTKAQELTENLMFHEGVFYPVYKAGDGTILHNGQWYQDVWAQDPSFFDPRVYSEADRIEHFLERIWKGSEEDFFATIAGGASNWEEAINLLGYPDMESFLDANGVPVEGLPLNLTEEQMISAVNHLTELEWNQADVVKRNLKDFDDPALTISFLQDTITNARGDSRDPFNESDNARWRAGTTLKEIIRSGEISNITPEDLAQIDWTGLDLSGQWFDGSDFTLMAQAGIPLGEMLSGTNLRYSNLSGADLIGADFSGAYNNNLDLTNANITSTELNTLRNLRGTKLAGVNVTGLDLIGKDVLGADFSGTTNFTGTMLNGARNANQNMNLSGLDLSGWDAFTNGTTSFWGDMNLANATGFDGNDINNVGSINRTDLTGTNLTGFTANQKSIKQTNFTAATGITGANLSGARDYTQANFTGINMTGFSIPTNEDLIGTNFSNTTNLTPQMLAQARSIDGIILTGTGLTPQDLLNAGISQAEINTIIF